MPGKTSRKVLIVEDNALNMRLFSDLLESTGYETLQCVDGGKAVGLALEEQPDLIIMDIQLPDVAGLDIARWLKSNPIQIKPFLKTVDDLIANEAPA